MTPAEKFNHVTGIARERFAKDKISFDAYSAILAAARTERDRAASSATKRVAVPPPAAPSKSAPTPRPTPKAERTYVRSGPARDERVPEAAHNRSPEFLAEVRAAELAIAAGAFAHLRPAPTADEQAADFARKAEAVAARLENREPRKHLNVGPSQELRHVTAEEILAAGRGAVI